MKTDDLIKFLGPLAVFLGKSIQLVKNLLPKSKKEQHVPQITITGNQRTTVNINITVCLSKTKSEAQES